MLDPIKQHTYSQEPVVLIYNAHVATRCRPRCLGHQVGTNACSPDPKQPQHLSFPTKWQDGHLL
ncbi:hypothetical protein Hanom_Chr04g00380771 [Helianthus anomalus]